MLHKFLNGKTENNEGMKPQIRNAHVKENGRYVF